MNGAQRFDTEKSQWYQFITIYLQYLINWNGIGDEKSFHNMNME